MVGQISQQTGRTGSCILYAMGSPLSKDVGSSAFAVAVLLRPAGVQPNPELICRGRIWPGNPHNDGRHQHMHLTLKTQTTKPPATNSLRQQVRFDALLHARKENQHIAGDGRSKARHQAGRDATWLVSFLAMPERLRHALYFVPVDISYRQRAELGHHMDGQRREPPSGFAIALQLSLSGLVATVYPLLETQVPSAGALRALFCYGVTAIPQRLAGNDGGFSGFGYGHIRPATQPDFSAFAIDHEP